MRRDTVDSECGSAGTANEKGPGLPRGLRNCRDVPSRISAVIDCTVCLLLENDTWSSGQVSSLWQQWRGLGGLASDFKWFHSLHVAMVYAAMQPWRISWWTHKNKRRVPYLNVTFLPACHISTLPSRSDTALWAVQGTHRQKICSVSLNIPKLVNGALHVRKSYFMCSYVPRQQNSDQWEHCNGKVIGGDIRSRGKSDCLLVWSTSLCQSIPELGTYPQLPIANGVCVWMGMRGINYHALLCFVCTHNCHYYLQKS